MPDLLQVVETNGPREGVRVIRLIGPCTLADVFKFQDALRQKAPALTIVDITEVPYMDSAAVGCVVRLHVSCESQKLKYAVVGASDRIRTLFHVTRVESVLVQYPTVDAALAAL
jgi:anti-sigma B factor antagonist